MLQPMRDPDRKINGQYLHRWYIIPKNRFFNIYLHEFHRSDDDRALHDHPWYSVSFLLKGEMIEHQWGGMIRYVPKYLPIFRTAKFAHRIEIVKGPVKTLFITGPRIRVWGFHTKAGWMSAKNFISQFGERE